MGEVLYFVKQETNHKVVQAHYYVRPLIVITISRSSGFNIVGKNVSSNVVSWQLSSVFFCIILNYCSLMKDFRGLKHLN